MNISRLEVKGQVVNQGQGPGNTYIPTTNPGFLKKDIL